MPPSASKKKEGKQGQEEKLEEERAAKEKEVAQQKKQQNEDADLLYLDGVKLQGEQKFLEAIDYFKKAYETNEEHLSAVFFCALLLEKENRKSEAKVLYDRCAALSKTNSAFKHLHAKVATFSAGM